MARLKKIYVIHTTSNEKNADTDEKGFQLIATTPGTDFRAPFGDNPNHNEREQGRTDEYVFDVSGNSTAVDSDTTQILMQMTRGNDGWLPSSMWVIGETASGDMEILGAHPKWDKQKWFDRGSNPAGPDKHRIDN